MTLEVTVTGPDGRPVDGAFVLAQPVSGAYRPFGGLDRDKVRSTLSGRDGKATLESLPPGPWTVTVQARGLAPQRLRRVLAGPLAVRLVKGGAITGVVRDGNDGRPVAEARVSLGRGLVPPGGWEERATRVEVSTDERGRFRLEGIGEPVDLVARAPGYGLGHLDEVRAGAEVEVVLFPGATLSGTVRDEEGRPVPGAEVRAQADRSRTAATPVRTDERGSFVLAGIDPGAYVVVARTSGRAPGLASVVVEPEREATVDAVVTRGAFVTGRLVDAGGEPLRGRVRTDVVEGIGLPPPARDLLSTETREDGTFALGPLPAGELRLAATSPGRTEETIEVFLSEPGRAADVGDVRLERGGVIRGRVKDREDNPLAGATITVQIRAPGGPPDSTETSSAEDGTFAVSGLSPGRHLVIVALGGYATVRTRTAVGGDPLEIVLEPGGTIVGRVVDAGGQPADDATVFAESAGTGSGSAGGSFRPGEVEGGFALGDLAVGVYTLQARAAGRGEATRSGVRVTAGGTTDAGTLVLRAGGVIRGTVVDAEGEGIPGATVSAERDPNMATGDFVTRSGSGGTFEIRGAPAGRLQVVATHPAFAASEPRVVDVDPEREATAVRLVLSRGGRIEGQAFRRDGRPFEGGRVRIFRMSTDDPGVEPKDATIGADGWFVIDHVAPGRVRVHLFGWAPTVARANAPAGSVLSGIDAREVEVREGETSTVTFELHDVLVTGQVTQGGQPAPGIVVSLSGPSLFGLSGGLAGARAIAAAAGIPVQNAVTREDGRYELLVFTPGPMRVRLASTTGQEYPPREVDIPDAPTHVLDLELPEATVSGTVVDRDSQAPLAASVSLVRLAAAAEPRGGGRAVAGPDGRFTIAAAPGDYRLIARAPARKPGSLDVSVGPAGLADLLVEVERGSSIRGRVVDAGGRPVPGTEIYTTGADGEGGFAVALGDGTFMVEGLDEGPHSLAAASGVAGYAVRPGVAPGGEPVTLRLEPGGRVAVHVVREDGRPVPGLYAEVRAVAGALVSLPFAGAPTDAGGNGEIAAPAGIVEIGVGDRTGSGQGTVTVAPGATVPLQIVLRSSGP